VTSATTTAPESTVPAPRRKPRTGWRNKYVGPLVTATAVLVCGTLLVATIHLTLFDLEWPAFLIGVLFASVVSLVCQAIKAQATIVRRTAQLHRTRQLLADQGTRFERCTAALKFAEQRFRAFMDAMPMMVLYVDREERCRDHNRAFGEWCGRGAAGINGVSVREVLGDTLHDEIRERGAQALLGEALEYESRWERSGAGKDVRVKLLPHPPAAQTPSGYYVLVSTIAKTAEPSPAAAPEAGSVAPQTPRGDVTPEADHLRAMEREIGAGEDAREYLLRAIEEDRFVLLEQKIVALEARADSLDLREILLRLRGADEQTFAPGGFFDVAEHHGVIPTIDRWVIRNLLKASASNKAADRSWRMPVYCVNLSTATVNDATFPTYIRTQLQHWQIAGNRLCFEISHGTVVERTSETYTLMNAVKPLGCRFAIDAFGSRKVLLAHLEQLEFNFAKIDGRIIERVIGSEDELRKLGTVVAACRNLGIRTVAQFVQDEATRATLGGIGVDYVQGFGVSTPVPLAVTAPV
jgi:PAS domain S-box-containing protein